MKKDDKAGLKIWGWFLAAAVFLIIVWGMACHAWKVI